MAKSKLTDKAAGLIVVEFDYDGDHFVDTDSNLSVEELTPEAVRGALNRAPAKYAYWAGILAKINDELRKQEDSFEFWKAPKYKSISEENPKATETYKNTQVMLDNIKEFKLKKQELNELTFAAAKCGILVKAYEMQSRTLQSVGSLFRTEMELSGND